MTATLYRCDRCGSEFITLESLEKHQKTTCRDNKVKGADKYDDV